MRENFIPESLQDHENRKNIENKVKNIIKIAENNLESKYPNLGLEFKGFQSMPNPKKENERIFMFDIWMEPLIMKQKPTTVTSLKLDEKIIRKLIEKTIAQYLISSCMPELKKKYPDIEIVFQGTGMGDLYYFNISSPNIIPSDGISDYPEDTFALKVLDKQQFIKQASNLLEKYKEANKTR